MQNELQLSNWQLVNNVIKATFIISTKEYHVKNKGIYAEGIACLCFHNSQAWAVEADGGLSRPVQHLLDPVRAHVQPFLESLVAAGSVPPLHPSRGFPRLRQSCLYS